MKENLTRQECYDAGGKDTATAPVTLHARVLKSLQSCPETQATLWTYSHWVPLSVGFSGKDTGWMTMPALLQGLFRPGIKPASLTSLPTLAVLYLLSEEAFQGA